MPSSLIKYRFFIINNIILLSSILYIFGASFYLTSLHYFMNSSNPPLSIRSNTNCNDTSSSMYNSCSCRPTVITNTILNKQYLIPYGNTGFTNNSLYIPIILSIFCLIPTIIVSTLNSLNCGFRFLSIDSGQTYNPFDETTFSTLTNKKIVKILHFSMGLFILFVIINVGLYVYYIGNIFNITYLPWLYNDNNFIIYASYDDIVIMSTFLLTPQYDKLIGGWYIYSSWFGSDIINYRSECINNMLNFNLTSPRIIFIGLFIPMIVLYIIANVRQTKLDAHRLQPHTRPLISGSGSGSGGGGETKDRPISPDTQIV